MEKKFKFNPIFLVTRDIDDCFYQLLQATYNQGRVYKKTSGSRTGMDMYALDFVAGVINYPHTRPLAPRMPEGSLIPPPTTDEKIESYFAEYLMNNKLTKNEHYRYSTWIVGGKGSSKSTSCGVNQIDWMINHFKIGGYGNEHCYIVIGNPDTSFYEYGKAYLECPNCEIFYPLPFKKCINCKTDLVINEALRPTTPCLRGLDFRIIDGYLTTHVIYRSWDLWGGLPENLGGFALLNQYVASHLEGVEPGPLTFSCKSLHCAADVYSVLKMRLGKE